MVHLMKKITIVVLRLATPQVLVSTKELVHSTLFYNFQFVVLLEKNEKINLVRVSVLLQLCSIKGNLNFVATMLKLSVMGLVIEIWNLMCSSVYLMEERNRRIYHSNF
jgi:hypothetical protein